MNLIKQYIIALTNLYGQVPVEVVVDIYGCTIFGVGEKSLTPFLLHRKRQMTNALINCNRQRTQKERKPNVST
jgi:hypothetical protein